MRLATYQVVSPRGVVIVDGAYTFTYAQNSIFDADPNNQSVQTLEALHEIRLVVPTPPPAPPSPDPIVIPAPGQGPMGPAGPAGPMGPAGPALTTALALGTTGADVVVNTAAPPILGQVLTATSPTAADWQTPPPSGVTLDGAYNYGGAGVGRAITANSNAVQINKSSVDANNALEITVSGGTGLSALFSGAPISAPGVGANSERLGVGTLTPNAGDIAIGNTAVTNGSFGDSIAIGHNASSPSSSVVIGGSATAVIGLFNYGEAVVIGKSAYAGPNALGAISIGRGTETDSETSVVAGYGSSIGTGANTVMLGTYSYSSNGIVDAVLLGVSVGAGTPAPTTLAAGSSVLIGANTYSGNYRVTSVGAWSEGDAYKSTLIGYGANDGGFSGIGIGAGARLTANNQAVIGASSGIGLPITDLYVGGGANSTAVADCTIHATGGHATGGLPDPVVGIGFPSQLVYGNLTPGATYHVKITFVNGAGETMLGAATRTVTLTANSYGFSIGGPGTGGNPEVKGVRWYLEGPADVGIYHLAYEGLPTETAYFLAEKPSNPIPPVANTTSSVGLGSTLSIAGGISASATSGGGNIKFKTARDTTATALTDTVTIEASTGNVILNASGAALLTSATGGFTYMPNMAGIPVGVPATSATGATPVVVDTSGKKLWGYVGGSWSAIGGGSLTVVPYTAALTALTANEAGQLATNTGAVIPIELQLPATLVPGMDFFFAVADNQFLRVTATGGATINVGTTTSVANGYTRSTSVGSFLHIVAVSTSQWFCEAVTGAWTVDA